MAGKEDDSELGRSKATATPQQHLQHLLDLGWSPRSHLITRYATEKGLTRELEMMAALAKDQD